ncbi:MAG: hypothetical protein FGM34_06525 [Solirubrobacteraceae bacterium]|nr:hypothetical protein [Solirubrobacteraceae bacterium]
MDISVTRLDEESAVRLEDGRLQVDGLEVTDPAAVELARQREELGQRLDELVTQMVEIGARVLSREQTAAEADYVRAEFERQARDLEASFGERAQAVSTDLNEKIDAAFGAEAGLVPRLLERHFGEESSAAVQNRVEALVKELLAGHKEALARQFTATDESNPLGQFQKAAVDAIKQNSEAQAKQLVEMNRTITELRSQLEGLAAQEEKEEAVAAEAEKGTAKGRSYEEQVVEALAALAGARGDHAEGVGELTEGGGKTGDAVVEVGAQSGPTRARIAFEAKDSRLSRPKMIETLDRAREQRSADFAVLVVPSDEKVPAGTLVLEEIQGDKMVVTWDPADGSTLTLETAYALARARVLMTGGGGEADAAQIADAADRALELLKQVKKIKNSLTSAKTQIDSGAGAVEEMAAAVRLQLERIAELTVPGEEG